MHATIHITDLSKGNEDGRLRIQLYSTAGVRKSLLINGGVSNGEYKLTVDLKTGLVYNGASSVEISDEENTLSDAICFRSSLFILISVEKLHIPWKLAI